MNTVRAHINNGMQIVYAGSSGPSAYQVRLIDTAPPYSSTTVPIELDEIDNVHANLVIKQNEGTPIPGGRSLIWDCTGWHRDLRVMSIMGLTVGGDATPGMFTVAPKEIPVCTMTYDLETANPNIPKGALPPPFSDIVCASVLCSCGYHRSWYTTGRSDSKHAKYCSNHADMVMQMYMAIMCHQPVWLVGYNCYQYDNSCLAAHADDNMHTNELFMPIRSSSMGQSNYAYYLNIPGVNNVDMYAYMDRVYRRKYKVLNLGMLARELGVGDKMTMPSTHSAYNIDDMIAYNMHDCRVTLDVWNKLRLASELTSVCSVMKAPMIDCVRYITGTMTSCMIASYCASHRMVMEWSKAPPLPFEGGTVLEPKTGVFHQQKIVDYAGMYPTIMVCCNISTETVSYMSLTDANSMKHGAVSWSDTEVHVVMNGELVSFDRTVHGVIPTVLRRLIAWRKTFDKASTFSTTIKVATNSIFGALGYPYSPIHSPHAASSVTMIGRWCLMLAATVFEFVGLDVLYGDTDSCFLGPTKITRTAFRGDFDKQIEMGLYTLHQIFRYTPMHEMSMELDKDQYKVVLLVSKKRYAMVGDDDVLRHKGLSAVRKDRPAICKHVLDLTLTAAMTSANAAEVYAKLADPVNDIMVRAMNGLLTIDEVSGVVRSEGSLCYKYTSMSGPVAVPLDQAHAGSIVRYDRAKIIRAISTEVSTILRPCRYGNIRDLLMCADDL